MTENPLGYEKISKLLKNFAVPSIVAWEIPRKLATSFCVISCPSGVPSPNRSRTMVF